MNAFKTTLGLVLVFLASAQLGEALPVFGFWPLKETQARLNWGGVYYRVDGLTRHGWVTLHYLEIPPAHVRPAIVYARGGIGTLSPVAEMVQNTEAVAAINANFFDPTSGLPVGFLLKDGRVLSTPYGSRATLAIGFFGELHFLRPRISLVLRTPSGSIPIDGVNRPAPLNSLVFYTPEYAGPRGDLNDARVIAMDHDRILWIGTLGSTASSARGSYWLVATGSARARVADLLPAERVYLDYQMDPERYFIRDALQAGPMLLRDGEISLTPEGFQRDILEQPAARSAFARTDDGSLTLMIVTKGNGSVGMTLLELAQYLKTLGAVDAMALDGGGSSSLVFRDGARLRTLGSSRAISVAVVFTRR